MSVAFPYYAKIRNKYCILYAGHCGEYLLQLKALRPALEVAFPTISIYLACRDDMMYLLEDTSKTLSKSELREHRPEFNYVRELQTNMKGPHPVYSLLAESKVKVPIVCDQVRSNGNRLCCIFTGGFLPTGDMNPQTAESYQNMAQFDGYHVWMSPSAEAIDQAGWVIGVEGAPLFQAASQGVRTSLVPTGIGTKFYKAMFPKLEILKK